MPEEYKACDHQLIHPPEVRGIPYDDWLKRRSVASRGAVARWIAEIEAGSAKPKEKAPSGALPANTEWM